MKKTLHFSIDLEAELRKITQRQYLNDVHYLVQLVRHALCHDPPVIRIRSRRQSVRLWHNGRHFSQDEWELLTTVLAPEGSSPEAKQNALSRLEEKYGVSVLSLLLTFPHVRIESGRNCLMAESGRVVARRSKEDVGGYSIEITRSAKKRKEEQRELSYFSSTSDVVIYFNGKRINRPIRFAEDQILITEHEGNDGSGAVGIPFRRNLSQREFYKMGVLFGMKRFPPSDGLLTDGYWNSRNRGFEPKYGRSITQGQAFFVSQRQALYEGIRTHFSGLEPAQKARIKSILLDLDTDDWADQWGDLPLFHSSRSLFKLTLSDLVLLRDKFDRIPYSPRQHPIVPAYIPFLETEDTHFLRNRMLLPLSLLQMYRKRSFLSRLPIWSRNRGIKRLPIQLDDAKLSPNRRELLAALNADSHFHQFSFTSGQSFAKEDGKGHKLVYLQHDHRRVLEAIATLQNSPHLVPLVRYRLLGLARTSHRHRFESR